MSNPVNLVASPQTPTTAKMMDPQGNLTWAWFKYFIDTTQALNNALNILGQFNGIIGDGATVLGHSGTLASNIQHLTASGQFIASQLTGVVQPAQLPPADPSLQGAVLLPAGAPSNTLGSAAIEDASAFDPAGSAAAAQAASDPLGSAAAAQTASEAYTDSKFASGVSGTVHLGPYTVGGTQGSLTLTNGLVTAFVDPT